MLATVGAVPSTVKKMPVKTVPNKGLPGITKTEKERYNQGELYKFRNEVLKWYCADPSKLLKIPCIVYTQLKKVRATTDIPLQDSMITENIENNILNIDKNSAKSNYKEMFTSFCKSALNSKNYLKICNNPLFMSKYLK